MIYGEQIASKEGIYLQRLSRALSCRAMQHFVCLKPLTHVVSTFFIAICLFQGFVGSA